MADWNIFQPTDASKPIHQILSGIQRGGFYVTNDNDEDRSRQALLDALAAAGYPAPSPSDPVYVHRTDTGNLERNTGNEWEIYPEPVEDTGWLPLPAPPGFTSTGHRRNKGGVVTVQIDLVATSSFSGGTLTNIALADDVFAPANDMWFSALRTSSNEPVRLRLFQSGGVNGYSLPSLAVGQGLYGTFTYLVN